MGWGNLSSGVLGVNHCAWSGDERIDSDTLIDRDSFTWDADDSNGIACTAYSLQAVMEHELGHGLSLGHSNMTCNGSASTPLMCPAVSNGTRKIILADDRAGAAFMYPLSGAAPGAPSGLAVTGSGTSRTLNWNASSGTKHAYDIERSSTGCSGTFKSINTVAASATSFVDNNYGDGLGSGTWCYRVKALGTGGDSGWSNTASGAAPTSTPTPTPTHEPPRQRTRRRRRIRQLPRRRPHRLQTCQTRFQFHRPTPVLRRTHLRISLLLSLMAVGTRLCLAATS